MGKNQFIYIEHILESIEKIFKYTESVTVPTFIEQDMIHDAVLRNFEIMGEATKKLSNDFREEHKDVPWKKMAGMRDILIHDYLGVDLIAVWNTIESDLPALKSQLTRILKSR